MKNKMQLIKELGIKKINLDFMYGLNYQNNEDILATIELIKMLNPEQVTVYEMRYNMVNQNTNINRDKMFEQYSIFYNGLISLGYNGKFGQNTFSKFNDEGLSSYLRYRVKECIPYKGFGISAQSMSSIGISYNVGKGEQDYSKCIENNSIYENDIYKLTSEELVAKYIAISLYYGEFNIEVINRLIKSDAKEVYKYEIEYLLVNKLATIEGSVIKLTENGFKYYGAVGSLFYSKKHKEYLQRGEIID
jgi:oxygen-independent coproporphyrinogen-3 oxidase